MPENQRIKLNSLHKLFMERHADKPLTKSGLVRRLSYLLNHKYVIKKEAGVYIRISKD
jgi:hypothetical protein